MLGNVADPLLSVAAEASVWVGVELLPVEFDWVGVLASLPASLVGVVASLPVSLVGIVASLPASLVGVVASLPSVGWLALPARDRDPSHGSEPEALVSMADEPATSLPVAELPASDNGSSHGAEPESDVDELATELYEPCCS